MEISAPQLAEDVEDIGLAFASEGDHLVERRPGVSHATLGTAGYGKQGVLRRCQFPLHGDFLELLHNDRDRYAAQIEALATGKYCGKDFVCSVVAKMNFT